MRFPRLVIGAFLTVLSCFVPPAAGQLLPVPSIPTVPGEFPPVIVPATGWTVSPTTVDATHTRSFAHPARLSNISIRAMVGGTAGPLVAGAVIQGTGTLPVLARAIGPGLRQFGITNSLPNPTLELFRGPVSAAKATAFTSDLNAASVYVGAFPLSTGGTGLPGDVALLGQAAVGTLTATCTSLSDASGLGLLEFYDVSAAPTAPSARFVNLSSRAHIAAGDGPVIIGFVVEGDGQLPLLLRGVGPTLTQFSVSDALANPAIELYAGATRIASNAGWRSGSVETTAALLSAGRAVGAFDLASDRDAAMLVSLPAGSYSLVVRGANAQAGTVLTEIYEASASGGFDAGKMINGLGMDIYRQSAATSSNLAVSPYSLQTALAMAYTGAAGDTRTEMARVLGFPDDSSTLQSGLADIRTSLDSLAAQSVALAQARSSPALQVNPTEWHAANRLFGQQGYPFRDSFLTAMSDGFSAPLQLVDFFGHAGSARLTINNWVADQTNQKITDLIPPGGVDDATRLALVNAIYLKASWDDPFMAADTSPRPFHPTPDTSHDVATMYKSAPLGYSAEDGMTIVTLDYLGKGLQFVIVLPDAGQTPEAAATRITPEHFARWAHLGDTGRRFVDLYLPKFKIQNSTLDLTDALQKLGLSTAFDQPAQSANFDGIAPRHLPDDYLFISDVFHKTFVVVDESGTEAAAATGAVFVVPTSAIVVVVPPVVVHVDRSFLFAIQHRASGACLFIGRIGDPQ